MKEEKIQLFHNQYRHIIYYPNNKKLITHWSGVVPESEQIKYLAYLQELIKIYDIEHFVINTKKVKAISLRPIRSMIENFLTKAYRQGLKTFTLIQKSIKNEAFVLNAYKNAFQSYGMNLKFEIVI